VVPALAVAAALRDEGAHVAFIGGDRAEARIVPAAGYELNRIAVEGLSRASPLRAARALALAARAVPRARSLLSRLSADAVLGAGGYVAAPVGAAAAGMGIPLVLTEADSHLGLSNRALAPFARRVCLAFPIAGREGPRYRVTGRPIALERLDREQERAQLGLGVEETCVVVFGGSLGARSINLAAVEAFARAPFRVVHVSGSRDYPDLLARTRADGFAQGAPAGAGRPRYELVESLPPSEFARLLRAADLVVARAGGSVFEIAAYGLPAILVPYPHAAGNHQLGNARWMAEAGAAVVLPDEELTAARLGSEVGLLLGTPSRMAAMAAASRAIARPDAAAEVAGELLAAAA
jgi:UDP-N-acetylglucosamine--N-acetylmuramyl-(pentapeptide) pyrophosphoryl-undecaprenol N-acetylglucosamine transferase